MFNPDYNEFCRLAGQGNLIPVYREFMADMETPVSVLSRFADEPDVFLFESVEGGERFGRYSFIGLHPRAVFTIEDGAPFLTDAAGRRPLAAKGNAFSACGGCSPPTRRWRCRACRRSSAGRWATSATSA